MRKKIVLFLAILCMLLMLYCGNSVTTAAKAGVELCLHVVNPSKFPFFVISAYITSQLRQYPQTALKPISRICNIPSGSEAIFCLGILGGYPVGAQNIAHWYEDKVLSKEDAERMLGFCNNAGPAFIFGMLGNYFSNRLLLLYLWIIQIISALITAKLLPPKHKIKPCPNKKYNAITISKAMELSLKSIGIVCGWVILFKILSTVLNGYLFLFPDAVKIVIMGVLELTNGCTLLHIISSEATRFVPASGMLSFGGICVHMQTANLTQNLRKRKYVAGKLLQTAISTSLAFAIQQIIFQYL